MAVKFSPNMTHSVVINLEGDKVKAMIFVSNAHAADNAPAEFNMRPIGHVKKSEDLTSIVSRITQKKKP